jgi:hypothetical protein
LYRKAGGGRESHEAGEIIEGVSAVLFAGGEETGEHLQRMRAGRGAIAAEDLAVDDRRTNRPFGAPPSLPGAGFGPL